MTPLIQMVGSMGGVFGPLIVGLVRENSSSYTPALFVMASFALIAIIPLFFVTLLPPELRPKRAAAH